MGETWIMYLLIVLQFIVEDHSIGLIRLGPGQCYAVSGPADLVDNGHCWWCWGQNRVWEAVEKILTGTQATHGHSSNDLVVIKAKLSLAKLWVSLTSLVGGDVDICVLWGIRTLVRHSVDSLYFERVLCMGQQVVDVDGRVSQSQLTWNKLHVVSTAGAATPAAATALTYDVVDNIFSATSLLWRAPLQPQRRLIHYGDDIFWSGWNSWRRKKNYNYKSNILQKALSTFPNLSPLFGFIFRPLPFILSLNLHNTCKNIRKSEIELTSPFSSFDEV